MSVSHIPNGFTSVTPYFITENVDAFIKFIKEAFDAEEFEMSVEDGVIRHFGFRIFGSVIEGSAASEEFKATKISIHLYVEDCDAVYKKALAAGGRSVFEVTDMPYGERSGGIEDPGGNSWWIATQKVDMYPEN
ncbi:MAG: VOC family protein [Pyrinomonadaceae bacterium]